MGSASTTDHLKRYSRAFHGGHYRKAREIALAAFSSCVDDAKASGHFQDLTFAIRHSEESHINDVGSLQLQSGV